MRDWWIELPDRLKDRVRAMGFGDFMSIIAFRTDRALICALSERWRDETHTFHFPPGEMTITLEDIARCWGLRVTGLPVFSKASDAKASITRLRLYRMFGARPQSGVGQIDAEWLREAYSPERRRILNSKYSTITLVALYPSSSITFANYLSLFHFRVGSKPGGLLCQVESKGTGFGRSASRRTRGRSSSHSGPG